MISGIRKRLLGALIAASLLSAGCRQPRAGAPHEALWLPPGSVALDGPASHQDGSASVTATVRVEDADTVRQAITEHYARTAWQVLAPTTGSGQRSDWEDAPGGGVMATDDQGRLLRLETRYWRGRWKDARGNRLQYTLKQTVNLASGENQVDLFGEFVPRSIRGETH